MSDPPAVSVAVPFAGNRVDAERLGRALSQLALREADEVVVADNSAGAVAASVLDGGVRVVRADGEWSSYHARNAAAAEATCEWILFMDCDCEPAPDLLDAYFAVPVEQRVGALAGPILHAPDQRSLA